MNLWEAHLDRHGQSLEAVMEGQRVVLPNHIAQAVASVAGDTVTLGIRPEDILLLGNREVPDGYLPVTAAVRLIEPMGHEQIVYLDLGSISWIVRTSNEWHGRSGDTVTLAFDGRKLHAFDPATEQSLLYSGTVPEAAFL
jgi:multiple sugar transport system ATP-binding protein